MTKRVIAVVAGLAGLGGLLAGAATLGSTSSSQALLVPSDYTKCFQTGEAGAVTTGLYAKAKNDTARHTVCGVYLVTDL